MSSSTNISDKVDQTPSAPDVCEECGNTDFISRSRPSVTDSKYVFAYHECGECGAKFNVQTDVVDPDSVRIPSWREVFGHPEPYDHQEEAIEDSLYTALDDGFTVMEGSCGTGKTMIALTAGLRLVKDPRTKYERVLVLTSVKQQLRQFEKDLRVINQNFPSDIPPARAVTLVGKTDLCPYAREEKDGLNTDNITRECRRLRDQTSHIMAESDIDGVTLAEAAATDSEQDEWETGGTTTPYQEEIPRERIQYCPFYANYKEHKDPLFTFGHAPDCILDPEQIVEQAVRKGVCPHSAMSHLCRDADVVIANYYHAFDSNTLKITHDLIDESTFIVCDEAHMLEPRVRNIMTTTAPSYMLGAAADEIAAVYNALQGDEDKLNRSSNLKTPTHGVVREQLASARVTPSLLKDVHSILNTLDETVNKWVESHLHGNHPNWDTNSEQLPRTIEIPLRDPTVTEQDTLSKWAYNQGIPEELWSALPGVAKAVENSLNETTNEGSKSRNITDVAKLLHEWFERDHTNYFREIKLQKVDDPHPAAEGWEKEFTGILELHNVMPRPLIGSRISDFGGGILMSATLEPMDVYQRVIGLDYLAEMTNTPVTQRMYRSGFPKENRLSVSLDFPKFTYSNRGDITDSTDTRKLYARSILAVAKTTPGNVLVCMPSYREASWAASLLEGHREIDKEVLVDQSSSEAVTQALKTEFIEGPPKVLVTSLRGTLTEGVDFDGDKLLGCIVCGVPIENVDSPLTKAVRTAYEDQFGRIGFDFGLTVPAVRKTRQALGRVIRGDDEVGVRVIADERYTEGGRNSVHKYLSESEKDEYTEMSDVNEFVNELNQFWRSV